MSAYPGPSSSDALSNAPSMTDSKGREVIAQAIQFLDNTAFVDHFGQLATVDLKSNVSVNWAYGLLDETFDVKLPATTGDGAQTAAQGYAEVSSASTGTAIIESIDQMRYVNGRGFFSFFTAAFIGNSGIGRSGPHDDNDGFVIEYNAGTSSAQFYYLDNGTPTDNVTIPLDATVSNRENLNIYAIIGGFLGIADPLLFVREQGWKFLGSIKTEGALQEPHVRLPAFPLRIEAENGMSVRAGSWHAGTMGDDDGVQDRGFAYPNVSITEAGNPPGAPLGRVALAGTNTSVLGIFRVKDQFNSLPNKIKVRLTRFSFSVAPTNTSGTVQVMIVINPTVNAPVYTDLNAVSSVTEIDSGNGGATGTVSGGRVIGKPININYAGSGGGQGQAIGGAESIDADLLNLSLRRNDVAAIVARDLDGNNVTIDWDITLVEEQI